MHAMHCGREARSPVHGTRCFWQGCGCVSGVGHPGRQPKGLPGLESPGSRSCVHAGDTPIPEQTMHLTHVGGDRNCSAGSHDTVAQHPDLPEHQCCALLRPADTRNHSHLGIASGSTRTLWQTRGKMQIYAYPLRSRWPCFRAASMIAPIHFPSPPACPGSRTLIRLLPPLDWENVSVPGTARRRSSIRGRGLMCVEGVRSHPFALGHIDLHQATRLCPRKPPNCPARTGHLPVSDAPCVAACTRDGWHPEYPGVRGARSCGDRAFQSQVHLPCLRSTRSSESCRTC